MAKENSSCLGSLVKGVLYFCFLPITLPVSIIKWAVNRRKRNRRFNVFRDTTLLCLLFGDKRVASSEEFDDGEVFSAAYRYVNAVDDYVRSAVDKMNSTSSPHVFFDNAESAAKYIDNLSVIEPYFPQLVNGKHLSLEEFGRMRLTAFKGFADRFIQSVEREKKQSFNRGESQLARIRSYEKKMWPEERRYFDKVSKNI